MPEAALYKHHRSELRKDQVWSSRKRCYVQSEPEASGVQRSSDATLRFGVACPDTRHHAGPGGAVNYVRHLTPHTGE